MRTESDLPCVFARREQWNTPIDRAGRYATSLGAPAIEAGVACVESVSILGTLGKPK